VALLQAFGIWFQLVNIADENVAMRARRRIERDGGPDRLAGTFAHAIAAAAAAGLDAAAVGRIVGALDVRPTLTAFPTEAKRVTVLEIHRRVYRSLVTSSRRAGRRGNASAWLARCATRSTCSG